MLDSLIFFFLNHILAEHFGTYLFKSLNVQKYMKKDSLRTRSLFFFFFSFFGLTVDF